MRRPSGRLPAPWRRLAAGLGNAVQCGPRPVLAGRGPAGRVLPARGARQHREVAAARGLPARGLLEAYPADAGPVRRPVRPSARRAGEDRAARPRGRVAGRVPLARGLRSSALPAGEGRRRARDRLEGMATMDATALTVVGTGVALFVALWKVQGNRFDAVDRRFDMAEELNRERFDAVDRRFDRERFDGKARTLRGGRQAVRHGGKREPRTLRGGGPAVRHGGRAESGGPRGHLREHRKARLADPHRYRGPAR